MTDLLPAEIVVSDFQSLTIAMIVFFLGALLTRKVSVLRDFNIPEPVSGGIIVALGTWFAFSVLGSEITFELNTRDELMILFFTTVGLNARFSDLMNGGRLLGVLIVTTVVFMMVQNVIGLLGALAFDLPPAVGVLIGSASLAGGHGTAIAWGSAIQDQTGFVAANEIGIAAATLGLIVASFVGGPIAKFLIERNRLTPEDTDEDPTVGLRYSDDPADEEVDHVNLIRAFLATNVAILGGFILHELIAQTGLRLPLFVSCLLMGILLSNTVPRLFPRIAWPARTRALSVLSEFSLSIFLAMSLMSMQLWTLSGLGIALLSVLAVQVLLTVPYILFVFFRFAGRDYTAAVLSTGFAGFMLGATPTAMANMSSVTRHFGPAPIAFIVLPLVSAFFLDIVNALIIALFTSI